MTDPHFEDRPVTEPEPIYWGDSRPGAATTGGVLLIVFGVLAVIFSVYAISQLHATEVDYGESVDGFYYGIWYGQMAFSAVQVVAGIFLLKGREWARIVGILTCSLNLVAAIVALFTGSVLAALVAFAINGGIIAALTRPNAREWCQEQRIAHRNG